MEIHQLSDIILEYRRECGSSDVVQSLCDPLHHENGGILLQNNNNNLSLINGFPLSSSGMIIDDEGVMKTLTSKYTHLLQIKGESRNEEIVRGRTIWKRKTQSHPIH